MKLNLIFILLVMIFFGDAFKNLKKWSRIEVLRNKLSEKWNEKDISETKFSVIANQCGMTNTCRMFCSLTADQNIWALTDTELPNGYIEWRSGDKITCYTNSTNNKPAMKT